MDARRLVKAATNVPSDFLERELKMDLYEAVLQVEPIVSRVHMNQLLYLRKLVYQLRGESTIQQHEPLRKVRLPLIRDAL